MLVDSKLPTTFWGEAVNTACYVLNRVLVTKPHNKTRYELIHGRPVLIDFMKPFGCLVTILNTRDHLGKFDEKADEGFFVRYSMSSKAMRVINRRTRIVKETLNIRFLENTPNVKGNGPDWLFDVDSLTISMNYVPVVAGNETNDIAGTKDNIVADPKENEEPTRKKNGVQNPSNDDDKDDQEKDVSDQEEALRRKYEQEFARLCGQEDATNTNSTNRLNTVSLLVNTAGPYFTNVDPSSLINTCWNSFPTVSLMDNTGIFSGAYDDEDVGAEADLNNLETTLNVSFIPTTRINKDHLLEQIIRDLHSTLLTKSRLQQHFKELGLMEPKKTLVDLPYGRKAIGTKWVFRNKRDQRRIVVRNKAKLVAQGYRQEEGVDYDEVFAPVARIEAIRLFLAYALFMDFTVYQMDMKSAFLYGTIEEEVYVTQPPGSVDPEFPNRVYKVEKAYMVFIKLLELDDIIFGSTKKSLSIEFEQLMHKRFQMSSMRELTFFLGLQVKQRKDGIFLSQDKYICDILKKFGFSSVKTASTPMEAHKPLSKDADGTDVDVHLYRSMIRSLMYLTSSRPDIMFVVCQSNLVLWYPKDSLMDWIAYSDSDYVDASLDRKSTTGGCQFLGCRLISWQCMKQTIVANSTTEAEYITKIHVDNESTICVVKNPIYHSKTKHIEIQHHFIRDSYEKRSTEMVKIHTDNNVADLLIKAFDVTRFQFLIASIGVHIPLFDTMMVHDQPGLGEGPTLSVESQHTPIASPSTSQPTPSQPTSSPAQPSQESHPTQIPSPMPHDSPLRGGHTPRSDEGSKKLNELTVLRTKLSDKVTNLEEDLKQTKKTRMILSDDEEELISKDTSKQGRKIDELDQDPFISLVQDEGMEFVHETEAETQEKIGSGDTEGIKESGDTEVLDIEKETSTAHIPVSTASASETVSTVAPRTPPTTTTVFDDEDISMDMA
ncbi:putative ribonuclease H-like domain-containing protein [Tanacetum coccineum]